MITRGRLAERELLEIGVEGDGPARPGRATAVLRGVGGGVVALGVVLVLALYAAPGPPARPEDPLAALLARAEPTLVTPPSPWRGIDPPRIGLGLDAPGFSGLPSHHAARIARDGAREDSLVFGAFDAGAAHLLLVLARPGEAAPASSFFLDMVRSAARAGLAVARTEQARTLSSRLGPLDVGALVLEGAHARACLGFRGGTPALAVSGWLCDEAATPADLACLIEGLTLFADGGEETLATAFARTTPRDPACPASRDPDEVAAIGVGHADTNPPVPPRRAGGS